MLDPIREGVVWAIMLLPLGALTVIVLVSFLGLTSSGRWQPRYSGYLTVAAIFGSFVLSLWALDTARASVSAPISGCPWNPWTSASA